MSVTAIPSSPRRAGRAAQIHRRTVAKAAPRPRLRLVTEDFVPEPVHHRDEDYEEGGDARLPKPVAQELRAPVRRPPRPLVTRTRRAEPEQLAPQHPAVRAARLRSQLERKGADSSAAQDGSARQGLARSPRRSRLKRDGALVIVAALVLVCSGLVLGGLAGLRASGSVAAQEGTDAVAMTATTVVRPGESLWQIAAATGSTDVAATMTRIVEINDLESGTVHAGQTLRVPVG